MKVLKIIFKISLIFLTALLLFLLCFCLYATRITAKTKLNPDKLKNASLNVRFFAADGTEIESDFLKNYEKCEWEDIPTHVANAFIVIEDKRFYSHHGIDWKRIGGAFFKNLKDRKVSEGASTISQQLIKNTHLSSEKTIRRKLNEIKLAVILEKGYSKEEILTMYLNSIYFGENCYGINAASHRYFQKSPAELTIAEAATLAAMIKAPNTYSPLRHAEKCKKRRNLVLSQMEKQGKISTTDYASAENEPLIIQEKEISFAEDYLSAALSELRENLIFPLTAYAKEFSIYTALDIEKQRILEQLEYEKPQNCASAVMITENSNGKTIAFLSDQTIQKRQAGSTLKPFAVYAPALEYNLIDESSYILDEPTDFAGYRPKNYGEKYYGYINAKSALAKSLNVPSVKILNAVGIEKAVKTMQNFGFSLENDDKSLALALGATQNGVTLQEINSAYATIANDGFYNKPSFIKLVLADNKLIYQPKTPKTAAISPESAFLLSNMLQETVTDGTAKKLNHLPLSLAAKTGTVGNNNGNSDAYCISFSPDFTVGCWIGAKEGLFTNEITGGGLPTALSQTVWSEILKSGYIESDKIVPFGVKKVKIDKILYEKEQKEAVCDDLERKKVSFYYKKERIPKTKYDPFIEENVQFSSLNYKNNNICILLCLTQHCKFDLFRIDEGTNQQVFLCTIENLNKFEYIDKNLPQGNTYHYKVIPYYTNLNNEKVLGKETLSKSITTPYLFS